VQGSTPLRGSNTLGQSSSSAVKSLMKILPSMNLVSFAVFAFTSLFGPNAMLNLYTFSLHLLLLFLCYLGSSKHENDTDGCCDAHSGLGLPDSTKAKNT
jgi:hypothetical protein